MAKKRRQISKRALSRMACAVGVCDPERTEGLQAPAPNGTYELVALEGPGVLLGAEVSKQGGNDDLTVDHVGEDLSNSGFVYSGCEPQALFVQQRRGKTDGHCFYARALQYYQAVRILLC
jgi:hypothetical protein